MLLRIDGVRIRQTNYFAYNLKSASIFYYKAKLHATIGNARKNLLIISNAMLALLFSVLYQY